MLANQSKSSAAKITCAQCGEALSAPSWSEKDGDRCVRYLWNCQVCGYEFETTAYLTARKSSAAVLERAA